MFQYGSTTYGLYSVKEDPTAVPHDENRAEYMTGVEVYRGEKLLFRGGVWNADDLTGYTKRTEPWQIPVYFM